MTLGLLYLIIWIPNSNSLKAKRMILHSLKARLRNNFNLAVTQVADEDKWQKATLAVVGVERSRKNMDSVLSSVVNFVQGFGDINLIDYRTELM